MEQLILNIIAGLQTIKFALLAIPERHVYVARIVITIGSWSALFANEIRKHNKVQREEN